MEYMRGWRALFKDPEWTKKLAIGSLLTVSALCIPMIGQLVLSGYGVLIVRRAVQGQDSPLPRLDFNMDYMGKLIGLGFKPMIAQLVYTFALVFPLLFGFYCVFGIGGALAAGAGDAGAIIAVVLIGIGAILYFVALLLVSAVTSVAGLRATLMEDLGAAMKPKAVWAMTKMLLKELIVGGIVIGLISMPIILVGELMLLIGIFPAAIIVMHIQLFYAAEVYKRYLEKGGEPLPVGPVEVPGFEQRPAAAPL